MADAKITKAPTMRPTCMTSPARQSGGSRVMKVTWKNPASATDKGNAARSEGVVVHWDLRLVSRTDSKKTLTRHVDQKFANASTTSAELNLNSFRSREFPKEQWTRDTFYPGATDNSHEWTKMWCLRSVYCGVYYYNSKGAGPGTISSTNFKQPFNTTVSNPEQDADTGHISCKVSTPKGDDHLEIHSGWWKRTVYDSRTKKTTTGTGKITRGSSAAVAYDVTDRMQLDYDQYVRFTVEAHTRGYWGDSAKQSKTLYVSFPKQPQIGGVDIPSKSGSDKVTVHVSTQQATSAAPQHPVTGVRLQVLGSCEWASESQIPGNADWEDLDVQDDGECTAISCTVSDVRPEPDTYTWLRVKTWNQIESIFYRYSAPYRLKSLETKSPTAAGDGCTITEAAAGRDGTSVVVTTAYDEDSQNTGTEIAWSKYRDAWTSTDQPDSFDATWATNTSTYERSGVTRYKGTVQITVRGLDPETTYYFKARRYLDGDTTTYSTWSNMAQCTTLADPEDGETGDTKPKPVPDSVTLSVPPYTPRGEGVPVTWTFQPDSGEDVDEDEAAHQTAWGLYVPAGTYATGGRANPEWVVATGTDAKGAHTIPHEGQAGTRGLSDLMLLVAEYGGEADSIALAVRVATGGSWRESEAVTARIADVPGLVAQAATVTAQPARIDFYSDRQPELTIVVRARGGSGEMPWGDAWQAEGDVAWSGAKAPAWRECDPTSTELYAQLQRDLADAASPTSSTSTWVAGAWASPEAEAAFAESFGSMASLDGMAASGTTLSLSIDKGRCLRSVGAMRVTAYGGGEWSEPTSVSWATSIDTSDPTYDAISVTLPNAATATALASGTTALMLDLSTYDWDADASVAVAQDAIDAYLAAGYAYAATVELPDGLDLWDGATYDVSATATDPATMLTSGVATCAMAVAGARQAPELAEVDATVTPHDSYDADGNHTLTADIAIGTPEGAADSDRFDVYRVTPDGAYLVYRDASADDVVTDPYAPYGKGELAYRVAVRTADGDTSWRDFPYELDFHALRVEFGSRHVELPYNIVPSDSYSKDFEARRYMDGSVDGFWNEGATRKAGFSTDLIKLYDRDRLADVRALAQHAGPCFVRTPEGCAFMADVQVTSIGTDYRSAAIGVSLDCTEVELTAQYMGTTETQEG
ncbi:MAG: hypothetical protein IJ092_00890 [Atopobiaceae bacterium]|nr:hypothetical protein [Atopobiaceae bacterium]